MGFEKISAGFYQCKIESITYLKGSIFNIYLYTNWELINFCARNFFKYLK